MMLREQPPSDSCVTMVGHGLMSLTLPMGIEHPASCRSRGPGWAQGQSGPEALVFVLSPSLPSSRTQDLLTTINNHAFVPG